MIEDMTTLEALREAADFILSVKAEHEKIHDTVKCYHEIPLHDWAVCFIKLANEMEEEEKNNG